MPTYLVRWEIDIDAESPKEAAEIALETQRDTFSEANVFEVFDSSIGKSNLIDLDELEEGDNQ